MKTTSSLTPLHSNQFKSTAIPQYKNIRDRNLKYFSNKRELLHNISESIIHELGDNRPYAVVDIGSYKIRGLLDSGANITVLGKGSECFMSDPNIRLHSLTKSVQTASGHSANILGYICVPVTYQNKTHTMNVFIAPSLQQELYLGIDFWNIFGMTLTNINEINTEVTPNESKSYT